MKFWHYLILAAAMLMLIGCFFLPNAVASITDSRRLDNLDMINSQSISFDSTPELDLPERLALVVNPKAEHLPIETGNIMDVDMAKEKVDKELVKLFRNSPFKFDFNEYTVEEAVPAFVIDAASPTLNLTIWVFTLADKSENQINVILDDETGYILKLIYRLGTDDTVLFEKQSKGSLEDELYSAAQSLVDMMKEYYGFPITLADYTPRGNIAYYRADLFGGGKIIPMYGVIRPVSFTMNERV